VVLVGYDNDNMAWLALNSWVSVITIAAAAGPPRCKSMRHICRKCSSERYVNAAVQA
jgi:hypothetical protein